MFIQVWREFYLSSIHFFLEEIVSLAVTSDNRYIVSGSSDKLIKVFDLQTNQEVHHFRERMKIWIDYKFIF